MNNHKDEQNVSRIQCRVFVLMIEKCVSHSIRAKIKKCNFYVNVMTNFVFFISFRVWEKVFFVVFFVDRNEARHRWNGVSEMNEMTSRFCFCFPPGEFSQMANLININNTRFFYEKCLFLDAEFFSGEFPQRIFFSYNLFRHWSDFIIQLFFAFQAD